MRWAEATAPALAVAVLLAGTPAPAARPRAGPPPPDLQGIWTNSSLTFLQRPPLFKGLVATEAEARQMETVFRNTAGDALRTHVDPNAPAPPVVKEAPQADWLEMSLSLARVNGELRSSWIVDPADGKIPFTDKGRAARKAAVAENVDGPEGRPLSERCLTAVGSPEGPPMMNTGFNAHYRIVQTRDVVGIEVEMNHDLRLIRMNDRTHLPDGVRHWMGDSVGWWEGDALVVETTNLDTPAGVDALGGGYTYGPRTRIVERFRRTDADALMYTFEVSDPDYLTKPFRGEMPMRRAAGPIYEFACHEGNYSLRNALTGARAQAAKPAEAKAVAASR